MKFGVRKVSLKKSLSARTTGKLKRGMKRAYNPAYGKKGAGLVNNPKKAVYNKVYNKTSASVSDLARGGNSLNRGQGYDYYQEPTPKKPKNKKIWKYILIFCVYAVLISVPLINIITVIGLFGYVIVLGARLCKAFFSKENTNSLIKQFCIVLAAAAFAIYFITTPPATPTTTSTISQGANYNA